MTFEREVDEDDRREAIRERRERFNGCKCGYPDMPGYCPGWRNCPMHGEPLPSSAEQTAASVVKAGHETTPSPAGQTNDPPK